MPNPRMKQRRVVHKSTAGILKTIPEAVDLVGNPPPGLTNNTVASLHQRVTANRPTLCQSDLSGALRFQAAGNVARTELIVNEIPHILERIPRDYRQNSDGES